jgi:uncharacterized protein
MFSIPTFPKLILLIVIVGAVWWWHRRSQVRARERAELDRNPRNPATKGGPAKPVEDMAQCRVCGAYVPAAGARNCGRDNCPF